MTNKTSQFPIMHQQHSTKPLIIAFVLFFLSPSLQLALINPAELPWHITPLLACVVIIAFLAFHRNGIRFQKISFLPVCLGIAPIVLHSVDVSPTRSLFHAAFAAVLIGMWVLATNLSSALSRKLLMSYVFAAFIWSLLGIIAWLGFGQGEMIHIGIWALTTNVAAKINGPFANGNVFGIVVFCAWAICLWHWLRQREGSSLYMLPVIMFFWAVGIASLSRGAWVVHALVVMIVCVYLFQNNKKRLIAFTLAFVMAIPAGLALNSHGDRPKLTAGKQLEVTVHKGIGERSVLWASVFEVWKQHAWIGTGYGQLGANYLSGQHAAFQKYQFNQHGLKQTTYAHNIALHLLTEGGVSGILLAIVISLLVVIAVLKNWNRVHSVAWPSTMIAVMLWLHGMLNISLTRPFPILLLCLALGMALRGLLRHWGSNYSLSKKYFFIPAVLTIVILSSGAYTQARAWSTYGEWVAEKNGNKGNQELLMRLLSNESTLPYVVGETAKHVLSHPSRYQMASQLTPYIKASLNKLETKALYQGLFFSHAVRGEMKSACEVGRFILVQNWPNEKNSKYYQAACEGHLSDTLEIHE